MDTGDVVVNEEELVRKHKQEKKELQAQVQRLKKSVPKGDKMKRKEVTVEIEKLTKDVEKKHKQEIDQLKASMAKETPGTSKQSQSEAGDTTESPGSSTDPETPTTSGGISRAQKRRNRKASEARERERRISEQAESNLEGPRVQEILTIKQTLRSINRKLHTIPADGNCLYQAINHQLQITQRPTIAVSELRRSTADFLRENKEEFLPFMYNETDESQGVNDEQFEIYCTSVATTKLWGGQLELRALSNILKCPIKVIQAFGPPTVQGEGFAGPPLVITYHRHMYRLGEHYNSTSIIGDGDRI